MSKQKEQNTQQNGAPTLPSVRVSTYLGPDANILLSGYEFLALQNGLTAVQEAQQAMQAILSRNIVEGIITMDFEKLDAASLTYKPMGDEEKAPYIKSFADTIEAVKKQQAEAQNAPAEIKKEAVVATPKEEAKVVELKPKGK